MMPKADSEDTTDQPKEEDQDLLGSIFQKIVSPLYQPKKLPKAVKDQKGSKFLFCSLVTSSSSVLRYSQVNTFEQFLPLNPSGKKNWSPKKEEKKKRANLKMQLRIWVKSSQR
jgi:hypothetical protein